MRKGKKHQGNVFNFVREANDARVACYHRKNYDFENLKSPCMAWFIQIAIRRDLLECTEAMLHQNDRGIALEGHAEISSKLPELMQLIRERHFIDELGLASIGLSLYNFPTLSHFFVATGEQVFVREATMKDLRHAVEQADSLVLKSRLAPYIPGDHANQMVSEDEVATLTNRMTFTKLTQEAGFEARDISKKRFLFVDMTAPTGLLTQQFLNLLERQPKLKHSPYDDWVEFGVLPFIDLNRWEQASGVKVKPEPRVKLVCLNDWDYGPRNIDEATRNLVTKLMDTGGPVFCGLLADASAEFQEIVSIVRTMDPKAKSAMVEEALLRWFPRTYPYNIPDLRRCVRAAPEESLQIRHSIDLLEKGGKLDQSIEERIRETPVVDHGTGLLRVMEGLRGKDACLVHQPFDGDTSSDFYQNDEDDACDPIAVDAKIAAAWSVHDVDLLKRTLGKLGLPFSPDLLEVGGPGMLAALSEDDIMFFKEVVDSLSNKLMSGEIALPKEIR